MQLTGAQRKQLYDALLDAFPRYADLAQVIRWYLNQNPALFGSEADLSGTAAKLIEWVAAQDRVSDLLLGARAMNPGNPALRKLEEAVKTSAPRPGPRSLPPLIDIAGPGY